MPAAPTKLFLPGFGAAASLYRPGLPAGWAPLDPPGFHAGGRSLAANCQWLLAELERRGGRVALAGHSMGAALAIAAAAAAPERVARLVLIAPAGLPLAKPITRSLREFACQVASGRYPTAEALRSTWAALRAPARAFCLARELHGSNLSREMAAVRAAGIETLVAGVADDSLVTPEHCRRAARLLGASYREVAHEGGHMWMLGSWSTFAELLDG